MFSKQTQSPTPESKIWGKSPIVQNMKHLSTFQIYLTIFEEVIYCYLQHISILTLEIIFLLHGRSNVLSILQNILVKIIKGSNLFCSSHHSFKLYSHFLSPPFPPSILILNRTRQRSSMLVKFPHSNNQINIFTVWKNVYLQMHPIK